jgi:hypothetical protein
MVFQTVTHSINLNGVNINGENLNGTYIISYNTDNKKYNIYGSQRYNQNDDVEFNYTDIINIPLVKQVIDHFNSYKLNNIGGGFHKKRYNKSLKQRKTNHKKRHNKSFKTRKTKKNKRK